MTLPPTADVPRDPQAGGEPWKRLHRGLHPRDPETIGPYSLQGRIGRGGLGLVYLARDTRSQKYVALKVPNRESDSGHLRDRFEREIEILSRMEHPGIPRLIERGVAEGGTPYFTMEYIRGAPIHDYCDSEKLSIPARLRLMRDTCHIVQHIHNRGVVHRDLKPENILIELVDQVAKPRVIDFGVARAPHVGRADLTLHGSTVGTPEYMAPEQAGILNATVDTRADIYSLGVVLHELLIGAKPLDLASGTGELRADWRERLSERDSVPPSTRIARVEDPDRRARLRQTTPTRLRSLIRGDLDAIVLKALADRDTRYVNARDLALDIDSFLENRPISPRAKRSRYVVGKFVRRNRALIGVASLALLGLVAAFFVTLEAYRAERSARARAEREEERATGLFSFVADLLSTPQSSENPTLEEFAFRTIRDLDDRRLEPPTRSALRDLAARTLITVGDPGAAIRELDRALGEASDPAAAAELEITRAEALRQLGKPGAAIEGLDAIADSAEPRLQPRLQLARARCLWDLASLDRTEEALDLALRSAEPGSVPEPLRFELELLRLELLELDADTPLADLSDRMERLADRAESALGEFHTMTQRIRSRVARLAFILGRYDRAAAIHEEQIEHLESFAHHQDLPAARTAQAIFELEREVHARGAAMSSGERGDAITAAVPEFESLLAELSASSGATHPDVLHLRIEVAVLLFVARRYEESLVQSEAVLRDLSPSHTGLGGLHLLRYQALFVAGYAEACLGRAEASARLLEAIEGFSAHAGHHAPVYLEMLHDYAIYLIDRRDRSPRNAPLAAELLAWCLYTGGRRFPPEHPSLDRYRSELTHLHREIAPAAPFLPWLRELVSAAQSAGAPPPLR